MDLLPEGRHPETRKADGSRHSETRKADGSRHPETHKADGSRHGRITPVGLMPA